MRAGAVFARPGADIIPAVAAQIPMLFVHITGLHGGFWLWVLSLCGHGKSSIWSHCLAVVGPQLRVFIWISRADSLPAMTSRQVALDGRLVGNVS
jgi:hypothetical protein